MSAVGIVKLDRHETLFGARLQILEHTLIAGIVGNHEQEVFCGFDDLAFFLDRQEPTVIAERMNNDRRIFPRLDHFVEVHNRAMLYTQVSVVHRPRPYPDL